MSIPKLECPIPVNAEWDLIRFSVATTPEFQHSGTAARLNKIDRREVLIVWSAVATGDGAWRFNNADPRFGGRMEIPFSHEEKVDLGIRAALNEALRLFNNGILKFEGVELPAHKEPGTEASTPVVDSTPQEETVMPEIVAPENATAQSPSGAPLPAEQQPEASTPLKKVRGSGGHASTKKRTRKHAGEHSALPSDYHPLLKNARSDINKIDALIAKLKRMKR